VPCFGIFGTIVLALQYFERSLLSRVLFSSIPHANAYRHAGTVPRAVVYCSFLPDVAINRSYVARQLQDWKAGLYPSGDQWIQVVASPTDSSEAPDRSTLENDHEGENGRRIEEILSTPLARRLAGWEPWDG
jgi:hypothetical protein